MSNTYKLSIDSLEYLPSLNGQSNVVNNVNWKLSATDGKNIVVCRGKTPITYVSANTFIPFSNLSESVVLGWVQSILGNSIATMQSALDSNLTELSNQNTVLSSVPWNQS